MLVAEYCGNCDKRTLRKVGQCPECTPENVESQTTDTQQLKAEILTMVHEAIGDIELLHLDNTKYWLEKVVSKLSAVQQTVVCNNLRSEFLVQALGGVSGF